MTLIRRVCRVLFALSLGVALVACGRKVELMAAMPEGEANEVMAALQNAGMAPEKVSGKEGMVGVTIPGDDVGRAVDLLREKGLPRERFAGMGQVFKKEGLISSPLEERARYLYALSQELGATISQIDGVITARVHVVLPERSPTGEAGVPSSAAVFIKHQDGYNLETIQPLIRRLVTNSIPGLTPEKVSIILINAQSTQQAKKTPADEAHPAAPAAPGGFMPLLIVLAVLLLASLAAASFLAWRYWWPQRAAQAASAKASA